MKWFHVLTHCWLQGLITELAAGLGSLLRRRDPSSHKEDQEGDDSLALILTPFDETQYCGDMANMAKKREER